MLDLKVKATGTPGHGSLLHESTAGEKMQYMINKFMNWREVEKLRLKNGNLGAGDVTSINLTMMNGGCQVNVVPPELSVCFDVRLSIEVDDTIMHKTINKWCEEAGDGVMFEFLERSPRITPTRVDDKNPWWIAFKNECDKM